MEIFKRGAVYIAPHYLSSLPLTEYRFKLLGYPIRNNGYANQAVFLLALNRDTRKADWGKEFIRFALGNPPQKALFEPITKLSVWKQLDSQQRQIIMERTSATLPPFDLRGLLPSLDESFCALSSFFLAFYSETFFKRNVSLERTVEMMSKVNLKQHQDFITFRWQS